MKHTRKEEQQETEILIVQTEGSKLPSETDSPALDLRRSQRKLIEDLTRLQDSLRGPEVLIDRTNYSRPFPPPAPRQDGRQYTDGVRSQEEPFGRS
jgi:hypothetical protein